MATAPCLPGDHDHRQPSAPTPVSGGAPSPAPKVGYRPRHSPGDAPRPTLHGARRRPVIDVAGYGADSGRAMSAHAFRPLRTIWCALNQAEFAGRRDFRRRRQPSPGSDSPQEASGTSARTPKAAKIAALPSAGYAGIHGAS